MADDFAFYVSHVRVVIDCPHAETLRGLRAVWDGCDRPLLPTLQQARFRVEPDPGGFAVHGPQGTRAVVEPRDVLPVLEAALYGAMRTWHAGLLALHAAFVAGDHASWLLIGRSGAGKSSLARAAVQRGLRYFSDEIALCDAVQLWGVPRAIQFAPLADGAARPAWLGDVDLESYRLRLHERVDGCVPLWRPPRAQLAGAPQPLERLRIVAVEHSTHTAFQPLSALELLAAIHEGAYRPPAFDLGPLVRGGGGQLRWSDPEQAWDCLLD